MVYEKALQIIAFPKWTEVGWDILWQVLKPDFTTNDFQFSDLIFNIKASVKTFFFLLTFHDKSFNFLYQELTLNTV